MTEQVTQASAVVTESAPKSPTNKTLITVLLIVSALFLIAATALTVIVFYKPAAPELAPNELLVEISYDSMKPMFQSGDRVICTTVADPTALRTGDVIAYWTIIEGVPAQHVSRIVNIYNGGDHLIFETRDDGNADNNPLTVHQTQIIGQYLRVAD